jgi:hypothetical protein
MLRRTFITLAALGVAFAATGPGLASPAPAEAPLLGATQATVDVIVIHATRDGEVDPRLERMGRTLTRAFRGYSGFEPIVTESVSAPQGQAQRMALPNQTQLAFTYLGVQDGFLRIQLEVGGMSSTVKVQDGGTFFQAGRGYRDGMIVLAFTARTGR